MGEVKAHKAINEFIDSHETDLLELWDKVQRGERITKNSKII